jgi:hypothetical protein
MDLSQKTAYEITRKGAELIVMLGARPAPRPAVKDAPAALPAGVTVISPDVSKAQDKPIEMTLEAAPIKPSDLDRGGSAPAPGRKTYTASQTRGIMDNLSRDPITFDYSEADIREVIDMLAAKAGINIIYSDDVTGTLTISLAKVPFDEAFKTILNVKGLAAQQVGDNILRIASPATLLAEQKKAMQQTRVFFLNYSKAAEVKVQVDSVASAEGRTKASCNADTNNNALVVTDTPLGLDATARLIRSLDRVPKQVVIEAKLVEVSLDNSLDYGISWSGYGEKNGTYFGSGNSASQVELGGTSPGIQSPAAGGGRYVSSPLGSSTGGSGVNLPANVVYGAFRLGKVASNYMFDAIITAAAKKGKAKVLSDPKVATLNNKEANINITTQIPYTTTEVTAATTAASTQTRHTWRSTAATTTRTAHQWQHGERTITGAAKASSRASCITIISHTHGSLTRSTEAPATATLRHSRTCTAAENPAAPTTRPIASTCCGFCGQASPPAFKAARTAQAALTLEQKRTRQSRGRRTTADINGARDIDIACGQDHHRHLGGLCIAHRHPGWNAHRGVIQYAAGGQLHHHIGSRCKRAIRACAATHKSCRPGGTHPAYQRGDGK